MCIFCSATIFFVIWLETLKARCFTSPTMSQTTFQQKYLFVSNHQKKARCFTNNEPHYTFQQKPPKKSPLLHQTQIPFVSNHKNKSRWCTNKKNKNVKNKISFFQPQSAPTKNKKTLKPPKNTKKR